MTYWFFPPEPLKEGMEPMFIRIDEDTKNRLKEIAEEEKRSLSNLVLKILTDYLKERDNPPPKEQIWANFAVRTLPHR